MSYAPESIVGEWTIEPRQEGVFSRLAEVWRYRHLLSYFAVRTLQALYKRTSLGWIWMVVRVAAPIGLNSLIFGGALGLKAPNGTPYFLFMLCGHTAWTLFDQSLNFITRSIERNRKLIAKIYFPRLILPMAAVSPAMLYIVILTLVLVGTNISLWGRDGVWYIPLRPQLLLAPVAVVISIAFAVAVGFWTSVLQARYRDIRFGLRYTLSFFMYATTVLYPLSQFKHPSLRWAVMVNPMETPVELFRFGTLGTPLEIGPITMTLQLLGILLVGFLGIWFFNREESASIDKL
jgi:lipopolysaccharide transport system permease protein